MTMHLLPEPFGFVASATRAVSLKTSVTPRLCFEEHSATSFPDEELVSDRVTGDGLTKVTAGSYSPGNGESLFVFYHTGTISC